MDFKTAAEARAFDLGMRQARIVPAEVAKPVFRTNAKGQPEYASIILTLDHLMENDTGHVNTKMVLSTEDPETALRSLWAYYNEVTSMLSLNTTLDQIIEYRLRPDRGIFLYITPQVQDRFGNLRLEVVMSTDLFAALSTHSSFGDGSEFVLIQKLTEMFGKVLADVNKSRGGQFPPLTFLSLDGQLVAAPAEPLGVDKAEEG